MEVFFTSGCAECHTIRGTDAAGEAGPDLTHVATRESIAAASVGNTTENLTAWIENPQGMKPGTQMEDISLSKSDLRALVAYLESLE